MHILFICTLASRIWWFCGWLNLASCFKVPFNIKESIDAEPFDISLAKPLNESAITRQKKRISGETIIMGEKEFIGNHLDISKYKIIEIPFTELAKDIGNRIYSNVIAAAVLLELFKIDEKIPKQLLKERFASKGEEILNQNFQALKKGYEIADDLINKKGLKIQIKKDDKISKSFFIMEQKL